ncbi:hypothetical protein QFC21_000917 [Naganishia friedmannii]|uniref:Uncharacterized protein n=1 Tax=Naganishia friedmannii TaxID=89922 RepID=A0ACC2W8D5_9TREE|nr:hypothetical protein QFC21_000917 [Naganishia friedmannii]
MDEPSQYALKKRTIRKNRQNMKQRRERGERDENEFRGPAKEFLKLELLQLLLRHQIRAVQEIWKLSNEIEVGSLVSPRQDHPAQLRVLSQVIARDVWLLVLSLYPLPEAPKPPESEQTQIDPLSAPKSTGGPLTGSTSFPINLQYSQSARSQPGSTLRNGHLPRSNTLPDIQSMAKKFDTQLHLNKVKGDRASRRNGISEKETSSTGSDDESSEEEQEDDNYGVDKELLKELSESSESSSTDEDEREKARESARQTGPGRKRTEKHWRHGRNLGANKVVTASVVLRILVISLWIMRVPVLLVDVMRAISEGRIPYLDFGRSTYIPNEIRQHMTKEMKGGGTWPKRCPEIDSFYKSVTVLVDKLERHRGIRMPDCNMPHVLWRLTKELGGTPSLYLHTLRLLQSVGLSMTVARPKHYSQAYHSQSEAKGKKSVPKGTPSEHEDAQGKAASEEEDLDMQLRSRRRLPSRRLAELCPVEVRLASAIIVVLKLVYGLDGEPRVPASWNDIACEFPTPSEWLDEMRIRVKGGWFRRHTLNRQPVDFAYKTAEEVDRFLTRASKVLLGASNRMADSQQVIDLFELDAAGLNIQPDEQDEILDSWKDFHRRATPNAPLDQQSSEGEEHANGSAGKSLLSGHSYRAYGWKGSEDDLPDELRLVVQAVAGALGVTSSAVLKELYALEVLVESASRKARGEIRRQRGRERKATSVGGRSKSERSERSGVSSFGDVSD